MFEHVNVTTLANGLRVVSSRIDHVQSVSLGIWVGAGARDESNKMAGASHFIEHLMFKGTEKRNARQISQSIEGGGGYLNAFTQEESTCYYARTPYDKAKSTLEVLADMFLNSKLDPEEIERERHVILEEIRMYHDQPQHLVHELLGTCLWPTHPLGRSVAGSDKALRGMTRASLKGFMQRHYIPARTVIAFAGRIEHETCVAWVDSLFGAIRKRRRPRRRKASDVLPQNRLSTQSRDIEQVHVSLGLRCPFGRSDERRFPLRVLNAMLGENMSSRLFQIVRERHGLAYSVHSSVQLYDEAGVWVVSAGLDRKRVQKAVRLICRELVRIRDGRISAAELKRARDYLVGHTRLGLESTSSQMNWLGETLLSFDKVASPDEAIANVKAVGLDDVKAIAHDLIQSSRASLAAVVPEGQTFDGALAL